MKSLYDYYRTLQLLPTYAGLESEAELARYAEMRERVFRECLRLPKEIFSGADVLDYGPDTGEDALVFARWGSHLTLVEPNPSSHPAIRTYFKRFALETSLKRVVKDDVLGYRDDELYDFVVAEGFIWTIHPATAWLEIFRERLRPGGMFIVTYYEAFGGFIELCLRALHAGVRRRTGLEPVASARRLYGKKWDSIPHTRSFESWVFDVLENPFLRAHNLFAATELVRDFAAAGFELYSSWPSYRDDLAIGWHKTTVSREQTLARSVAHIERSALSFLCGVKLYLTEESDVAQTQADAAGLLRDVDGLIDADDGAACRRVLGGLASLRSRIERGSLIADAGGRERGKATLDSLARAFLLAAAEDTDGLVEHAQRDEGFIGAWGVPNHLAVGRRVEMP